jgi:hypothetical protein
MRKLNRLFALNPTAAVALFVGHRYFHHNHRITCLNGIVNPSLVSKNLQDLP